MIVLALIVALVFQTYPVDTESFCFDEAHQEYGVYGADAVCMGETRYQSVYGASDVSFYPDADPYTFQDFIEDAYGTILTPEQVRLIFDSKITVDLEPLPAPQRVGPEVSEPPATPLIDREPIVVPSSVPVLDLTPPPEPRTAFHCLSLLVADNEVCWL